MSDTLRAPFRPRREAGVVLAVRLALRLHEYQHLPELVHRLRLRQQPGEGEDGERRDVVQRGGGDARPPPPRRGELLDGHAPAPRDAYLNAWERHCPNRRGARIQSVARTACVCCGCSG
eukprot:gene10723-biopygen5559